MDERGMAGFITGLKSVEEVEAGIYEVVVILQRGTTAKLRMNAFTFQAFVTKFIMAPGPERRRAKPIELVRKVVLGPLRAIKWLFKFPRMRR